MNPQNNHTLKQIISVLAILFMTLSFLTPVVYSYPSTSNGDTTTRAVLGVTAAELFHAQGTNDAHYWGTGSWEPILGVKFEMYIPADRALGTFTINDIERITYHTKTPHPINGDTPLDFYLVIYTRPDGVDDHGWYGYKLIAEPYYSNNLDAPADTWVEWTTDPGTNQLTFYDPDTTGDYGAYGQPTLQDLQAGPINWHDYQESWPETNIDYGSEEVMYISFQTGSGWADVFQGYIDAITITLKNGTSLEIDLEGPAPEVWVNTSWTGLDPGTIVDDGKIIGYNATSTITEAIKLVQENGTIYVEPGSYIEQLYINKSLTLQALPGAKIVAPDSSTRTTYTIPESGRTFDPIIFINGTDENITVSIIGFEIDGRNTAESGRTFVAVLSRNNIGGAIKDNTIHNMYPPSGEGSGPETMGILVYANASILIENNTIRDFSRGGIGVIGLEADYSYAIIRNNTIYGNGLEEETGWWAENGIQLGLGSFGIIENNKVYDCQVNSPYWASTAIMIIDTSNVIVRENIVIGSDIGIAVSNFADTWGYPWDIYPVSNIQILNNIVDRNRVGIDIENEVTNVKILYNNITNSDWEGIDIWNWTEDSIPSNIEIHYNNIEGNYYYGVWANEYAETVNATLNWWGDPSGPSGESHGSGTTDRTDGVAYGSGDTVSSNVLFSPWLNAPYPYGEPITGSGHYSTVTLGDVFDATEFADMIIETSGTGQIEIGVLKYNKTPTISTGALIGKYYDIHINTTSGVDELFIKIYYEEGEAPHYYETSLRVYWWDGSKWVKCSDTGVNTEENYVWVRITNTSSPSLSDLQGTPIALGGTPVVGGSIVDEKPAQGHYELVGVATLLAAAIGVFFIIKKK